MSAQRGGRTRHQTERATAQLQQFTEFWYRSRAHGAAESLMRASVPDVPLWRLVAPDGRVATCFVDPLVGGDWLLLVWDRDRLTVAELHPSQGVVVKRAGILRSQMVADGWAEPGTQSSNVKE